MCIFADACDVAAAQHVLRGLPEDAYGQVYLADDSRDALPLDAPPRVQINRVCTRAGAGALADAMAGWAAEWLPAGSEPACDGPTVWVLPGAASRLTAGEHDCVTQLITALPSNQLLHG